MPNPDSELECFPVGFTGSDWAPDKLPIRDRISQLKVLGMRRRSARVFDRYKVRRSVLLVQESRQAKDPVAVGASRVSTEGHGQQFEQGFLLLKGEAFDPPKHLVFARRCGHDCVRNRDRIRGP